MFPGYAGSSGTGGRSNNNQNEEIYSSYNIRKIEEQRKEKQKRDKVEKFKADIKEAFVHKSIRPNESDDSDNDECMVLAEKAIYEEIDNAPLVKLRTKDGRRTTGSSYKTTRGREEQHSVKNERSSRSPSCSKSNEPRRTRKSNSSDSDRDSKRRKSSKKSKKDKKGRSRRGRSSSSSTSSSSDDKREKRGRKKSRKRASESQSSDDSSDDEVKREKRSEKSKKSRKRRRQSSSERDVREVPSTSNASVPRRPSQGKYQTLKKYLTDREVISDYATYTIFGHYPVREWENYHTVDPRERSQANIRLFLLPRAVKEAIYPNILVPKAFIRLHECKPNDKKTEKLFVRIPHLYDDGYIKLSDEPLKEFKFLHEIAENQQLEISMQNELHRARMSLPPQSSEDAEAIVVKQRAVNKAISANPRDDKLYLQLIDLEDQLFEANRKVGLQSADRNSSNERKLEIIKKGLKMTSSLDLLLRQLSILKETEDYTSLNERWAALLHIHVDSFDLWKSYLDFIQYDSKMYTMERLDKAFDLCFAKIGGILDGSMKSHTLKCDNHQAVLFLQHLYSRRLLWWIEAGFIERAVASLQATIEYTLLSPSRFASTACSATGKTQKRNAFRNFWSSGVPRVGDAECKGWFKFDLDNSSSQPPCSRALEKVENEVDVQLRLSLENRVLESEMDDMILWTTLEREIPKINYRPRRTELSDNDEPEQHEFTDDYRIVSFDDIRIFSYLDEEHKCEVIEFVSIFGGRINMQFTSFTPVDQLAREWKLPFVEPLIPPPALELVVKMMQFVCRQIAATQMTAALYPTFCAFLECSDIKDKLKQFKLFINSTEDVKFKAVVDINDPDSVKQYKDLAFTFIAVKTELTASFNNTSKDKKMKRLKPLLDAIFHRRGQHGTNNEELTIQLLANTVLLAVDCVESIKDMGDLISSCISRNNWSEKIDYSQWLLAYNHLIALEQFTYAKVTDTGCEEWSYEMYSMPEALRAIRLVLSYCIDVEQTNSQRTRSDWYDRLREMVFPPQLFDDSEIVRLTLAKILHFHWKTFRSHKEELMTELLSSGTTFNNSTWPLQLYITMRSKQFLGTKWCEALRNIEELLQDIEKQPGVDKQSVQLSLARICLFYKSSEDISGTRASINLRSAAVRAAIFNKCPYFWRLAIISSSTRAQFEDAHVEAAKYCRFSRNVHLDAVSHPASNHVISERIQLLMVESGLRNFTDLDYVDNLKNKKADLQDSRNG